MKLSVENLNILPANWNWESTKRTMKLKSIYLADLLENGLEDTGRGKGKLGRSERVAWTYIHYQM